MRGAAQRTEMLDEQHRDIAPEGDRPERRTLCDNHHRERQQRQVKQCVRLTCVAFFGPAEA